MEPSVPDAGEPPGSAAVHDHRLLADVEPLDVTGIRTVSVGTVLFLLGGLALLPFHGWLAEHDRIWWLWTCFAGFGLGVFGFDYCRRRARHLQERRLLSTGSGEATLERGAAPFDGLRTSDPRITGGST